jgi:hypothetical protein
MKKLTVQQAQELAKKTGQKAPRTRRGIEGALVRETKNADYYRTTENGIYRALTRAGAYENCLRDVFDATEKEIEEVLERAVL